MKTFPKFETLEKLKDNKRTKKKMEILNKIWSYITFKKNPEAKGNSYLRAMHGINKLSIAMFLVALVVLAIKCSR